MPEPRTDKYRLIEIKNRIAKHFTQSDWRELGVLTDQYDLRSPVTSCMT